MKCQRRQSSCKLLVQLCHAVFENVVFLLMIFLKQCVWCIFLPKSSVFFPMGSKAVSPPRQRTEPRQGSWGSPQQQCLLPALHWVPPSVFLLVILCVQWKSAAMNESNCCWWPGPGNSFTSLLSGLPGTIFQGTVPHRCPPSQRHLLGKPSAHHPRDISSCSGETQRLPTNGWYKSNR